MRDLDTRASATPNSDARIKASDLLVKALENEGVEYIFGVPGEENLDFVESLRTSNIRLILTRHEQAAGFMAATYEFLGMIGLGFRARIRSLSYRRYMDFDNWPATPKQ